MIVCFHCSTETKEQMDELLTKDNYRDYSELIAVAVGNLWMLDREIAAKGTIVIGESATLPSRTASTQQVKEQVTRPPSRSTASSKRYRRSTTTIPTEPQRPLEIPDLFLRDGLEDLFPQTIDIQPAETIADEVFTVDSWIFGQYNKLLPVKASCRALLRITAKRDHGASINEVAQGIAEDAAQLGDYLANHDIRHQIGRDESLATAFPRTGHDAEKGRIRYANQFVGYVNSLGRLSSLPHEYRLVGLAPGNEALLLLTKQGMEFARLENPILDSCQSDPTQKFSPEEIDFLLEHIRCSIPVERYAFFILLKAIADGANNPDKLAERIRAFMPTESTRSLKPSFITSQRSGALSRMSDLGLIERIRNGVRVSYVVTEQGKQFIESDRTLCLGDNRS